VLEGDLDPLLDALRLAADEERLQAELPGGGSGSGA
jgi:hypothetical protein